MFKKIDGLIRDWNHRRIDLMRAWKLNFAQMIFPLLGSVSPYGNQKGDIIVFRLDDKLGDSLTATGFLHALKLNFPMNRLVVLSGKNSAFIYKNLRFIDEVHVVKKGLFRALGLYLILRSRSYRYLFNTSHILNPQVVFLSSFLNAPKKLTFLNPKAKSFTDHVFYDEKQDHVTVRYQRSLEAIGIYNANLDYHLALKADEQTRMAEKALFELHQKGSLIVVLNSFAGARLRNFNQQTTTEIVQQILQQHQNAVVVSVGNEDDLQTVQRWISAFQNPRWVCFSRNGSLAFNLTLAQQSQLIVTPDTSWVHFASAFKRPVIAVYREDDAIEKNSLIWAPYQTPARIVYAPFDSKKPYDINTVDTQVIHLKINELLTEVK